MELSVGSGEVLECLYGNYGSMLGVHEEQPLPLSINTVRYTKFEFIILNASILVIVDSIVSIRKSKCVE
jgi:hypothetical protein